MGEMIMTNTMRRFLIYMVAICLLPGCQSTGIEVVEIDVFSFETLSQRLAIGDHVEINTIDGEVRTFEITAISQDSLSGEDTLVDYTNIESLSISRAQESNPGLGIAAIVLIVIVVVAAAAAMSSGSPFSGSGGVLGGGGVL